MFKKKRSQIQEEIVLDFALKTIQLNFGKLRLNHFRNQMNSFLFF